MKIKANLDFVHNNRVVYQATVIEVSNEDGNRLIHSGVAFETSEDVTASDEDPKQTESTDAEANSQPLLVDPPTPAFENPAKEDLVNAPEQLGVLTPDEPQYGPADLISQPQPQLNSNEQQ